MAPGAGGVEDIIKDVVLGDPAVGLGEAAGEIVHAVGGAEGQLVAVGAEQVRALGRVDVGVGHGDRAAGGRALRRGVPRVQVVPGVVANVVGALGLVDAQQVNGPSAVGQRHADAAAVD